MTKDSLEIICDICLSDKSLVEMGRDGIKQFFNNRIFIENDFNKPTVLILNKENQTLAVTVVTTMKQNNKELSTIRIVGIKNSEENLYQHILFALADVLISQNSQTELSIIVDNTVSYQEQFLKTLGEIFISKAFEYKLQL